MIVNTRSIEAIKTKIQQPFVAAGFDPDDGVLSEMIGAIVEALGTRYSDIYSLARNTKISTADETYLENHYGVLLDEPRESVSYIDVNDLSSIYLTLLQGSEQTPVTGRSLTRDGEGILIPKGTPILSNTLTPLLVTKNTVRMTESVMYITAVSLDKEITYIPADSLTSLEFDLAAVPNINPAAIGDVSLRVRNTIDLVASNTIADTDTYRYVLQQKAASVNLSNDDKLSTIFDILTIRNYVIDRINHGSTSMVVYIDTTSYENEGIVLTQVDRHLTSMFYGTDIRVRPFIKRYVSPRYKISFKNPDIATETKNEIATLFANTINVLSPGSNIDFHQITEEIRAQVSNINGFELDGVFIDDKELSTSTFKLSEIERIIGLPEYVTFIS